MSSTFKALLPEVVETVQDSVEETIESFIGDIIPPEQKENIQKFLTDLQASIDSPPSEESIDLLKVTVQDAIADKTVTSQEWQAIAQATLDVTDSMGITRAELRTLAYDLQDIAEASRWPREDQVLIGTGGNDWLQGRTGADTLIGSPTTGIGEIDLLVGGGGTDTFVLGDESTVYYNDGRARTTGLADYALIVDFNIEQDTIQLAGAATDYSLGNLPGTWETQGTTIYQTVEGITPELIGVLAGVEVTDFSKGFVFVG